MWGRVKKLAQGFNITTQYSNPGSRSRESEGLPLSHCALHELLQERFFYTDSMKYENS